MQSEGRLKNLRKCAVISTLCLAILVLWGLLSLVFVFFNMPVSLTGNTRVLNSFNNSRCSLPFSYTQGVCYASLMDTLSSHNSDVNATDPVPVAMNNEAIARSIVDVLNQFTPSAECSQNLMPFLCLYLFGICGDNEELLQPTMDQCKDIQFRTCAREWTLATALRVDLPNCTELPVEQNVTFQSNMNKSTVSTCQENFFLDEDLQLCVPSCPNWSQHDEVTTKAIKITILASSIIGFLLAIIVLILSIVRRSSIFKFPSVFLVYSNIDIFLFQFFLILGNSDASLYCPSSSLVDRTVTPFCVIHGMVFTYVILQLNFWWMFHLAVLLWGVFFPFHYDKYKKNERLKYVHLVLVACGLFLPIVSIIGILAEFSRQAESRDFSFASGGLGFAPYNAPGVFCGPESFGVAFYTVILPLTLMLGVVGTLALLIIYGFYKHNKLVGTAEKKLALVFGYYVLIMTFAISTLTTILRSSEALQDTIREYFLCEAQGNDPNNPCARRFEQYQHPVLLVFMFTIAALFPMYLLIFVMNFDELKLQFRRKRNRTNKKSNSVTVSQSTSPIHAV